ncbi:MULTISPECIES: SIR2 family protein [Agrobacterium]|uniref:SIR2 family protein n=1 Tax=Agrobacterium TaxID=357 RepID=UPI002301547F|nr:MULTISPECIES: SIR2 family protein [Agrobacterium]MDA5627071.1 SIR2 family protein [Agrobacterium sp. ST15.16.055]MDA6980128.1 SIR2 family protein [Agrobacterium salinitolerans]
MFRDNTVFVVGAGASAEFRMPVGTELMKRIKEHSQPDTENFPSEINHCLIDSYRTTSEIGFRKSALTEINRSIDLAGSIDEFINRHQNDQYIPEVGKLLIAYEISVAERKSSLWQPPSEPFQSTLDAVDKTWIHTFAQLLFDGVKNFEVESVGSNITIICFNYDRCIEHFLAEAIVKTFRDVTRDQARRIVSEINIIHPYGSLGALGEFEFGDNVNSQNIRSLSENIFTWSEARNSSIEEQIQKSISSASTLVFLGFAFAPQNMRLLAANDPFERQRLNMETFATAYGYDSVIDTRLKSKIRDLYSDGDFSYNAGPIHIQYDKKCAEFLRAHSMALVV